MIKRGQAIPTSMFILFELILVIVAGAIVFNQVRAIEKGGVFHKKFFAPDLALLISSIQQVEGNVYYTYTANEMSLSKFDFEFKEDSGTNFVYVDEERYPFSKNRDIKPFFAKLSKPSVISITKEGDKLIFQEGFRQFNGLAIDCSAFKEETVSSITLDPGHGYNKKTGEGDKGFEEKSSYESEINKNIANMIKLYISNAASTRDLKTDDDISMPERINAIKAPALISIHAGSSADQKTNNVKAYVNFYSSKKQASMYLACNILNRLSDAIPLISGTAIVPVDLSLLPAEDSKQVLLPEIIAVQLEIGNIQNTPNNFIINNQTIIANAIKEALK